MKSFKSVTACARWIVALWVAVCLVGCSAMQTVPHPQRFENVQKVIQVGDAVQLVTVYNDHYTFHVTRIGDGVLIGQEGETTFEVPFPAIARMEVRRETHHSGGLGHLGGGKGAAELLLVLVVVALGVSLFKVVQEQVVEYRQRRDGPPPVVPPGPRRIVVPLPPETGPAPAPA